MNAIKTSHVTRLKFNISSARRDSVGSHACCLQKNFWMDAMELYFGLNTRGGADHVIGRTHAYVIYVSRIPFGFRTFFKSGIE